MKASLSASIALAALLLTPSAMAQVNVTTYHNDNFRTGWNSNETLLNQNNLGSFGLLQSVALDDQVDAEPLLVNNLTVNGAQHNVVYVATENNSVYGIDAQSGQVLLQTNLGAPVPMNDLPGGCNNNGPNVGIGSTPVIDTTTGALYVIADVVQNNVPTYYLHALSLTTLADILPPATIAASGVLTNKSVYQFNASVSRQRAALLLANGNIYAGFASYCDVSADVSRGWVLGWQESTLAPLASNKLTNTKSRTTNDFFLTSIWMSGYGLAANANGSVYFVTGNSDYSGNSFYPTTNIAESAAELSGDLSKVEGLYTPTNRATLDRGDIDFGSGGLMLLPPQQGISYNLAAAAGKWGSLYLLDADELRKSFGAYSVGGCWCGPSYYQGSDGLGRIVTSGGNDVIVWSVNPPHRGTTPKLLQVSDYGGIANGQNGGFFDSVSSNGTQAGTAVVWAVGRPTDNDPADVDLYAVNPDNGQLLFSEVAGQWPNTNGDSNIVPLVANGFVYVASNQMLTIFGMGGADKKVPLPKIRHAQTRAPLAAGEHEIYGLVSSMDGATITVERGGKITRLDATLAKNASNYAPPSVGHALIARGSFDKSGVLLADTILHAVDHPAMWPSDR